MVHSVRRRESDGKIEFFQQLNKYMEPFTLRETAATLWDMSKTQLSGRGLHERCIDVEDPKNIFVTKFQAERIVHVWRTIIEGEGKFSGKCLEETGWVRLRPSPEMAEPGTLIEMCIRKFPRHLKSSKSDDGVGQFHEAVQGIGDTTEAEIISLMENVLIEDTLAGILS
ncbi:hypothetical protein JM16_009011 [Phytophthora kernoviae]|nr:hypothetical protein JM16_009011 [Phytophthora kernoviae]